MPILTHPITLSPKQTWAAITVIAALLAASATVTWEIRKDVIEELKREVESYKTSSSWKVPETLTAMKKASEALALQLAERNELSKLRAESKAERERTAKLEGMLKDTTDKLASTQATLNKLVSKANSVELNEGQSVAIIENTVYLGIKDVGSNYAYVSVLQQSKMLDVGETFQFSFGNMSCRVTLLRVSSQSPRSATFGYGCA